MKVETKWECRIPRSAQRRAANSDQPPLGNSIYSVCWHPSGSQVIVACANKLFMFDYDGTRLKTKKEQQAIYAVDYSHDGALIASGGRSCKVILWNSELEPQFFLEHKDPVQCIKFNPNRVLMASACSRYLLLWSRDTGKKHQKKLSSRALCMEWTSDGEFLAVGQMDGTVTIRDTTGHKVVDIERNAPVWCLSWGPDVENSSEVLAVGCWDQTLSFYSLSGERVEKKDRPLDYDPCAMSYFEDGRYLMVAGSNHKVSLYTSNGVFLKVLAEREDWVWSLSVRPRSNHILFGCNDGILVLLRSLPTTVHGLYHDRYASREAMTDIIIQHLITEAKVRIRTRDYVKKIAVYKNRLAVQLPDRILLYETDGAGAPDGSGGVALADPTDMHYRLKHKLYRELNCNLLVVTAEHIILCQERKLQLYNVAGAKLEEWVLDAVIRYIRVVGGPQQREGLLVGLKNGAVFKIFVNNRFPVPLIKHHQPIRCLDLNSTRKKLAVVDAQSRIYVYDLATKEVIFEEANANSVAWNTEMEHMFCYSGDSQLCIKTGDFPLHKQPLHGFVVGFKGSKIFCLHYHEMRTIDVPQSVSLHQYLEQKNFEQAYKIACLGVTNGDWRTLALNALMSLELEVARKAFIRVRDVRYVELVNRIEIARKAPDSNDDVFRGDILAYQGKFDQASAMYCRAGFFQRAIDMYHALKMWDKIEVIMEQQQRALTAKAAQADAAAAAAAQTTPGLNTVTPDGGAGVGGSSSTVRDAAAEAIASRKALERVLKDKANWLAKNGKDVREAANAFWQVQQYEEAIRLLGERGLCDELIDKVRTLSPLKRDELQLAAKYFREHDALQFAKEVYLKLDDIKSLMRLHVELGIWSDAFALARQRPELAAEIYQPYAHWLLARDRFREAQQAFRDAGIPEQSLAMLQQLCHSAIVENRFRDAGHLQYLLAQDDLQLCLDHSARSVKLTQRYARRFRKSLADAELYYAYDTIYHVSDDPFSSVSSDVIFHTAQYILNGSLLQPDIESPTGIRAVLCLYALAKQGLELGAFKTARHAFERLSGYVLPGAMQDHVEASALTVRTRPFSDHIDVQPICQRCAATNLLLSQSGENCATCGNPFVRCFVSFEPLPLVEFKLQPGITLGEAMKLIERTPPPKKNGGAANTQRDSAREQRSDNVQTLMFDDDETEDFYDDGLGGAMGGVPNGGGASSGADSGEQFHQLLNAQPALDGSLPSIVLGEQGLAECPPEEVFVQDWCKERYSEDTLASYYDQAVSSMPVPPRFFRLTDPTEPIVKCDSCQHLFQQEDWEVWVLEKHECPFCRIKINDGSVPDVSLLGV